MQSHSGTGADALTSRAGEYLSFRLGAEEYGIDILKVQEIRGYEQPTRMVNAPSHVLGVLNLRGTIVPILDMRLAYGLTPTYDGQTVSIVLNIGQRVIGMVVDAVSDVVELKGPDIKPAPAVGAAVDATTVIGIATLPERLLILLDIDRLADNVDPSVHANAPELQDH